MRSTASPNTNRTATYNADDSLAGEVTGITSSYAGQTFTDTCNQAAGTLANDGRRLQPAKL